MSETAVTMTLAQFCQHINVKRSYGHQLKAEGRLVLAADGKSVLVVESIARIAGTRDPSKAGVAARHAATRGEPAITGHEAPADEPGEEGTESDDAPRYDFQSSKAKREHYAAERERAAFRKEAGELMERGEVIAAFADAGATLRGRLESWAAVLPPQLAGRDEAAIRNTIADQVDQLLNDLVDKFNRKASEVQSA